MEYNEIQYLRNPKSPENILGLFGDINLETVNDRYESLKENLFAQREQGQTGDGSRIIPDQEFEERMSEIEEAYKVMLERVGEDEVVTAELDPDFPNKINS